MPCHLALLTLASPAHAAAMRDRLEALSIGASGPVLVGEAVKPNINGGDLIWRASFAAGRGPSEAEIRALERDPAITQLDWATFESQAAGEPAPQTPGGIYRCLLLATPEDLFEGVLQQFDDETVRMPDHIRTILRWTLGRVTAGGGARRWTHVWEQEYADLEGFTGEYMMNPYHWGFIDRWYDIESPERIVDRRIGNSLCPISRRVIV
jgi:hypothetical protein